MPWRSSLRRARQGFAWT